MQKILVLIVSYSLAQLQMAYAAEGNCQPLPNGERDVFVELLSEADANALLQVNVDDGEVCVIKRGSIALNEATAANFSVSAALDELVVEAAVDGYETWLRIDSAYSGELLLDRATSEKLGLTDAEFIGDNSQLEASDFFIEYVGSLEIGGIRLRSVETNIPLLEVPYDHYADRGSSSEKSTIEAEFLTVGSIGEEILEATIIVLGVANQQIYMTQAN